MDKVNPYNYQNNKVNEAIFKLNEMMEKLTIDHLIPYSNHKLGLMDLSSLGHIPTTMTLEGFDLHLKDKPLIAERTNWSLEEIKPILHPLSDLTKEIDIDGYFIPAKHLFHDYRESLELSLIMDSEVLVNLRLEYPDSHGDYVQESEVGLYTWQILFEWHFDVFGLIEKGLAIDINTLK